MLLERYQEAVLGPAPPLLADTPRAALREHGSLQSCYPFDVLNAASVALCESARIEVSIAPGRSVSLAFDEAIRALKRPHRVGPEAQVYFLLGGSIRTQTVTARGPKLSELHAGEYRARFSLRHSDVMQSESVAGASGCVVASLPSRILGVAEESAKSEQAIDLLGRLSPAQLVALGNAICSPYLSLTPPRSLARMLSFGSVQEVASESTLIEYFTTPASAYLMLTGFAMIETFDYGREAIASYVLPGTTLGFSAVAACSPSLFKATQRREGSLIAFDALPMQALLPNAAHILEFDSWR